MDRQQILAKPKLNFSSTFKQAFKIITSNPKFIFITIIFFSFPLFSSLLIHHILLHPTFIQLLKLLHHGNPIDRLLDLAIRCIGTTCTDAIETLKATLFSHRFLISTILFSALVYFLDLLNTIATVSISAALYGGNSQLGFKDMLIQVRKVENLKGTLGTSLCALLWSSLTLLALIVLPTNHFLMTNFYINYLDIFFYLEVLIVALIVGLPFVALLAKYIEWSAVWNMGIVISIVDKNPGGYIAIGVASYLSRGSRKLGFSLMMVFFVYRVFLWFPYLYTLWIHGSCGILGNVVFVGLNCVGNIVMWVVVMVYFYDCKREFLEKKIDLENNIGKPSDASPQ